MRPTCTRTILACTLLVTTAFAMAMAGSDGRPVPLKKGDCIVFVGDSTTAGGVSHTGYVALVRKTITENKGELRLVRVLVRFPDGQLGVEYQEKKVLDMAIIATGIGGRVPLIQARLEKDVLAKKPTVVVIDIGINDVRDGEKNPARGTSKEKFEAGLKEIIGKINSAGARVILCTPRIIGEKTGGGNNLDAKLDEYSDISRKVAKDTKSQLCDLRRAFTDYLKKNNADNKASGILTSDGVNLNEAGKRFVAEVMLKSLGE